MTRSPRRGATWLVAPVLAGLVSTAPCVLGQEVVTRDVHLMGTSARLSAVASSREDGIAILDRAIHVIEEVEAELSTWRDTSAISRINVAPPDAPSSMGPALCSTFGQLTRLSAMSGGAFDPAIGQLTDAWDIHGTGRIPSPRELALARRRSGLRLLRVDQDACTVTRLGDVRVDVGAWGKGEALDRVRRALPDATWLIDFGGQIAVNGVPPGQAAWPVYLAHPRHRHQPVLTIDLRSGSVSTSAGSERDLTVRGRRVAHHLDPRTGQPARFTGAVIVWHAEALVADALSTALYVMGPDTGWPWAERHGIAAAFLVARKGVVRTRMTTPFRALRPRPVPPTR